MLVVVTVHVRSIDRFFVKNCEYRTIDFTSENEIFGGKKDKKVRKVFRIFEELLIPDFHRHVFRSPIL